MFFIFLLIFLIGCSHPPHSPKKIYEQGYRQGVQEQVGKVVAQFQGGNFPYYHWSAPIVQEVRIPGHLANGVMIPEHQELVIIKPGEWTMSGGAYPIQTQEGKSYDNQISYMDVGDITSLPHGVGVTQQDHAGRTKRQDYPRRMENSSK